MSRYFFAPNVGVIRVEDNTAYLTWEDDTVEQNVPLLNGGPDKYIRMITNCGWLEICRRKYVRNREEYARRRRERR